MSTRVSHPLRLALSLLLLIFVAVTFSTDAHARRLGGGGSFGMKRNIHRPAPQKTPPRQQAAPQAKPANAASAPQRSGWLGPIAGIAAGIGLAALFSHLGLGEELASLVVFGLLIFGALLLFRRLNGSARQMPADLQAAGNTTTLPPSALAPEPIMSDDVALAPGASPIPAIADDFDEEAFIRHAKVQFIRLQAANDQGNLADIQQFTTPEVFAEIKMQFEERGQAAQRTDIIELYCEMLDLVEDDNACIASIHFHGNLREAPASPARPFSEAWHLSKAKSGHSGWLLAGIEQLQ